MEIKSHKFKTNPEVSLPIIHLKGKKKGKTGFISGGIHGDEINGMMLVKQFLDDFKKKKLEEKMSGELIILPILNPTAFNNGKRKTAPDKSDLNRAFPGKKTGTFSQQFANELFEKFISKSDFAIDCHDAGGTNILLPHTRVSPDTLHLGRLFGSDVIVQREGEEGMMALEAFKKYKVPLVTVEIGGAKHVAYKDLEKGVEGIKNILKSYGILPGKAEIPKHQYLLKSRYGIKAEEAGIIEFTTKLGAKVHAGQTLGSIYYPQNYKEAQIVSPMCGIVFAMHDQELVKKGSIMFSILEFKECHIERTTLKKFEELAAMSIEEIKM